ncbi:translocation/assembly module TamB domain-containing protein [Oryzicola mucosus]|uniref:Translocation/assembly module TamB domain-containing protein n=1 Tax=Oryzicola mucosus TaxID=2767425 RepID=A0A8J6PV54_9HYPH|nr:translocation/assembly module TamB domain-containing protein [Oryzicola mucosus]MBD0414677.1 translocation/assembly module TamB domain-containing protein [Oryzicola mucosus]
MKLAKRLLRILRNVVLLVLALAIGAVAVFTLTARGRDNLAGLISTMASSPDMTVRISGIDGIWSGALTVENVVIGDRDGAWLALRDVAVDWSPTALLSRTFRAESISAQRIEVARLPKASETPSEPSSTGFSLPVSIDIAKIDLPDIAMGEVLAGSGVAQLSADGMLRVDRSINAIESKLNVARTDGKQGTIVADINFAPNENTLVLNLQASEPQGGIIANLLGLSDQPAVQATLSGEGPLADWSGQGNVTIDGAVIAQLLGRHQAVDGGNRFEVKGDGQFDRFVPDAFKPVLTGATNFDLAGTLLSGGGVELERGNLSTGALTGSGSGIINPQGASDFSFQLDTTDQPVALSFGDAQRIDVAVKNATVRIFGDGAEPMLDVGASLAYVFAGGTKVHNLDATIHSDGFNVADRSGPVDINLAAGRLETDVATLAPLVAGQVKATLGGSISQEEVVVNSGTITSDTLNGTVTAKVTLADLAVELAMSADVATIALPEAVRAPLDERVQFSATATRDAEGAFAANEIQLTSGALTATGLGSLSGDTISADIKGSYSDISRVSPVAKGAIDFALTARGPLSGPDLSFDISSSRLEAVGREINDLKLTATGRADFANPAADVKLSGSVGGEALSGNAVLRTTDGQRRIDGLALSLGENKIAGDIVLDEQFLPVGKLTINLPDISPLAALALDSASGDVTGSVDFTKPGGVPQVQVVLNTASLTRGDLSAQTVAIDALLTNYVEMPTIAGTIKAETVTSGTTVVRDVDVALTSDGEWTSFDGGAVVTDIPARAAGRVRIANGVTTVELASADATIRGLAAAVSKPSTITVANGTAELNGLAVTVGGGTATINGTAGSTLNLDVALANVPASLANTFSPELGLAGSINGTVKATGEASNPSVAYDISATGMQTAKLAGVPPVDINSTGNLADNRLTFQATVANGGGLNIRGDGSVTIADTPTLDINATLANVPAALANSFSPGLGLAGTINGTVKATGPATSPTVAYDLRATGLRTAQMAGIPPLNVNSTGNLANNRLTFQATVANGGGMNIRGEGSVSIAGTPTLDVNATLANVPAALANSFSPGLGLAGTINGTVRATGPATSPNVAYDLRASGVQAAALSSAGVGSLNVTSTGNLANNRLTFQATIGDGFGTSIQGGGSVNIAGTPALDLTFSGRVPFAILDRQLAAQSVAIDGAADVNVTVRGPASAPVITGSVRASGARVVYASAGLAVNDLSLDIAIANNVATINRMDGTLSSGGRLSVSGTVGTAPGSGFPANITITVVDGRYTDGQVVAANFSANLAIRGQLVSSPTLSGSIDLARTVITIPTNLPASLAQLNVQHRNPPPAVKAQDRALRPEEATGGQSGLKLDIDIRAANRIFIQGRGVDAEMGGNLKLVGPATSPSAVGQFTMTRGRLEVLGQRLDFSAGSVTFAGSLVPTLNFTAESSASDATVTINITGAANNPRFTFSSVPALPEDEVLARLIFGRSMSNLSPLQIAQLASAAAELAGVDGATSLLTTLRNRLGVDDLDLRTTEGGGTAVSVGKYLNDRTYLTLEKGDQPGSGRVGIDLRIGRGVKLRGEARDDGEAKGGIFYEKEY